MPAPKSLVIQLNIGSQGDAKFSNHDSPFSSINTLSNPSGSSDKIPIANPTAIITINTPTITNTERIGHLYLLITLIFYFTPNINSVVIKSGFVLYI